MTATVIRDTKAVMMPAMAWISSSDAPPSLRCELDKYCCGVDSSTVEVGAGAGSASAAGARVRVAEAAAVAASRRVRTMGAFLWRKETMPKE